MHGYTNTAQMPSDTHGQPVTLTHPMANRFARVNHAGCGDSAVSGRDCQDRKVSCCNRLASLSLAKRKKQMSKRPRPSKYCPPERLGYIIPRTMAPCLVVERQCCFAAPDSCSCMSPTPSSYKRRTCSAIEPSLLLQIYAGIALHLYSQDRQQ